VHFVESRELAWPPLCEFPGCELPLQGDGIRAQASSFDHSDLGLIEHFPEALRAVIMPMSMDVESVKIS
jgi:hypothetical protein